MNGADGWLRTAIGVAGAVRVSSARTSCAAAAVVETSDDRTGWDAAMVTPPDIEAQILRYYHAEKWTMGTIARQLHVHYSVVERVLAQAGLPRIVTAPRRSLVDAYLPFISQTLETFPTLTASRLYGMVCERGYSGRPDHFRHLIARHRPRPKAEAYLRLRSLPGEQAQVDWGHFGPLEIGRARRPLMAFVMVLSHSRQIFLRFFPDARMESFLRGHAAAFDAWGGVPRVLLYDNLKSVVLERRGDAIRFHPTLIAFAAHYRYDPRPVAVARGNEKGRVEHASVMCATTSLRPESSPISTTSMSRPRPGAMAWRRIAAAPDKIPSASARPSPRRRPGCWRCRTTPIRSSSAWRSRPARPPMCASTSTIIPSRTPRCSACSRCWPIRTRCASSMARRCSSAIAAATTRGRRSRMPPISRPWSSTSAPRVATAAPTTSQRWRRKARPCSCTPPSAATISEPSPPPCCGCWSVTEPPSLTPPFARRSRAACLIPMRCGSHSNTAASCATRHRPSPSFCPSMSRRAMPTCSRTASNPMTNSRSKPMSNLEALHRRAKALNLHGLLAHWEEAAAAGWLATLIDWEEQERTRRSLERRLRAAHIGRFKPLCDFDWTWPKRCDPAAFH